MANRSSTPTHCQRSRWKRLKALAAVGTAGILLAAQLPVSARVVPSAVTNESGGQTQAASCITAQQRYAAAQMTGSQTLIYEESSSSWLVNGSGSLTLKATVPAAGAYRIAVEYRLDEEGGRPLLLTLSIGGKAATQHELPRVYATDDDGTFERDAQGNDIQPAQITVSGYVVSSLRLSDYMAGEDYAPELTAGENTLTFAFEEQQAAIRAITLFQTSSASAYQKPAGYQANADSIVVEAEHTQYASSAMLYPLSDRTSVATTPYHYSQIRLNAIGGDNWKDPGQWISWEIPVKKAGYYKISLRVRQNITRGMKSFRRIYIDGAIPCAELDGYAFRYDRSWQVITLGNGTEDCYFYLDEGVHTLTMEAAMGSTTAIYESLETAIRDLNALYLKIVKITGVSPDLYRTYNLDTSIPGLVDEMKRLSGVLEEIVSTYESFSGSVGTELSFLREMAALLDTYGKDPSRIAATLGTFNSNISTMSTLLTTLTKQPLLVDKIQVSGEQAPEMQVNAGFFDTLVHGVRSFFSSFITDYTQIGGGGQGDRTLKVWITSGRDQANMLKSMIDDTFTPKTGINVQLSLVNLGLAEAAMAGRAPDLALGVARTVPIDMGARGILTDLTDYTAFESLRGRFQQSALNAYTYKNRVFGLPETQDFYMMYVRTDILEQLGVELPKTWDDLMSVITTLSQENMEVGVPQLLIGTLLAQNGMTYYQEGFEKTVFSTEQAYDVYDGFIKIYRDYKQSYNYNAANRFKTGVMPIVFDLLSFYNTMSVLAPEIKGQWEIYELPGTRLADGSIARGGDATGVASILFKTCQDTQAGFEFLDWWTSAQTQTRYGLGLENLLGPAGRYAAANVEAFSSLNWTPTQTNRINAQREFLREIPEIPGSYIISRNLTNLFLDVMNNGAILRESMLRYARIMDDELARKKVEMDLLEQE